MPVDLGDLYPITVEIRNSAQVLTNATSITLTITLPDQTTVTPTFTNPSTGRYEYDYPTVQAGRHSWRATSTGPAAAFADQFDVRPADPGYIVSLIDAKQHLNIPAAITTHDEELRGFIEAVTEVIENDPEVGVGAIVRRTITDERHRHDGYRCSMWLHRSPVISVTTVTPVATGGAAVTVADLDVDPNGQISFKDGYTRFPIGAYKWTYQVGRLVVPANITKAALIIVKHLWDTQRGTSGNATTLGGGYAEEGATFVPGFGFAVPRRAVELLRPHRQAPAVA